MDNPTNSAQPAIKHGKSLLITILAVIITAGVIGGLVYWYMKSGSDAEKASLQGQVNSLQLQVQKLQPSSSSSTTVASPSSSNSNSQNTSSSSAQVASWKTYTNTRVHYQFEYPASGLSEDLVETIKYPSTVATDAKDEDYVEFITGGVAYSVEAHATVTQATIEAWLTDPSNPGNVDQNLSDYTKTTVAGKTAYTLKSGLATYLFYDVPKTVFIITARDGIAPKASSDDVYSHLLQSFSLTPATY